MDEGRTTRYDNAGAMTALVAIAGGLGWGIDFNDPLFDLYFDRHSKRPSQPKKKKPIKPLRKKKRRS